MTIETVTSEPTPELPPRDDWSGLNQQIRFDMLIGHPAD